MCTTGKSYIVCRVMKKVFVTLRQWLRIKEERHPSVKTRMRNPLCAVRYAEKKHPKHAAIRVHIGKHLCRTRDHARVPIRTYSIRRTSPGGKPYQKPYFIKTSPLLASTNERARTTRLHKRLNNDPLVNVFLPLKEKIQLSISFSMRGTLPSVTPRVSSGLTRN